jgi:dTDP-4-amino-4,6-dideoxygalactose transaminase
VNQVAQFEKQIADYFGAPYAVATDCCTHAIELCLRLHDPVYVECPAHTYLSVPMTFSKLNIQWKFSDVQWKDYYTITNTNIIDAAVFWKEHGYIRNTLMCLSFQFKKHLNLGRGGMILLDNAESYAILKKMRYDGRDDTASWAEQNVDTMGYHYYMTPEIAQEGINKFNIVKNIIPKEWNYLNYPNLKNMEVFKNV